MPQHEFAIARISNDLKAITKLVADLCDELGRLRKENYRLKEAIKELAMVSSSFNMLYKVNDILNDD